jgi:hypothetical protein
MSADRSVARLSSVVSDLPPGTGLARTSCDDEPTLCSMIVS